MNTIKLTESRLKSIITEAVKQALNENMGQQYRIDLKTSSLTNQQTSRQIRSLLNSGKPTECTLNMFYGNAFSCDATFTTKVICNCKGIDGKEYPLNEVTESGVIGCKHRTHEKKKSSPSRFGEQHSQKNALIKAVSRALSGKECALFRRKFRWYRASFCVLCWSKRAFFYCQK